MGNDGMSKVIGDICLQTNMGIQLWHRGAKHASDVRFNLIFVHVLDDGDYDNHFGCGKWKLTKDMLLGLKNAELKKCSHCMAGKQTRISFKKHPPSRKLELLKLVHSYVRGLLKFQEALSLYFEDKRPSVEEVQTIPDFGKGIARNDFVLGGRG
ncbi:hypothetical protein CR513_20628, partial [Mucuna pruriens]